VCSLTSKFLPSIKPFLPRLSCVLLTATFIFGGQVAEASVTRASNLTVPATKEGPTDSITVPDGFWSQGLMADGFVNFTSRKSASNATKAYLTHDDAAIYVGFVCSQKGVPITASTTTNNTIGGTDDSVTFTFDTTGNGARVYTFSTTANGLRSQTSSESARFDPPWTAKARSVGDGWVAEMVIPLASIRADAAQTAWRVNVVRHVGALNEDYTWAYDAAASSPFDPTYWPLVDGFKFAGAATRPKARADIFALGSAGFDRRQFQQSDGSFVDTKPRNLGVDVNLPVTNTLAFVGTLAPDFSNVEIDQQTITPQEFRRALSEYRPFFTQGAAYLDPLPGKIGINGAPDTPFYTPFIGAFDRGFKLEGTLGHQSIGLLNVRGPGFDDQAFGYQIAKADQSLSVSASAVLAHHDAGFDQTLGLGVSRMNVHSGESSFVSVRSESGSLTTDSSLSRELSFGELLNTQKFTAFAAYQDVGPQYSPIDGYTKLSDARGPLGFFQYNGVGTGAVKTYSFALLGDRFVNRAGQVRSSDSIEIASVTFKNLVSVSVGPSSSLLRITDPNSTSTDGQSLFPFKQTNISLGYRDGTSTPTDASYSWGPFTSFCSQSSPHSTFCGKTNGFVRVDLRQFSLSTSRPIGKYILSGEYDDNRETAVSLGMDGQILRRFSVTRSLGSDASLSVSLRNISGTGGFAVPGTNAAAALHVHFHNQNELYFDFGSPASTRTLNRFILKYSIHLGGGAGT